MKTANTLIALLLSITAMGQPDKQKPGYLLQLNLGLNVLSAPSRLHNIGESSFEAFQPVTMGLTGGVIFTPIKTNVFSASYFNEFSAGMLYTSTHYYNHWGFRGNLGYKRVFLQVEQSSRYLSLNSYTFEPTGASTSTETFHYSEYKSINRQAIGLQIQLKKTFSSLEFGYFRESFDVDKSYDPWSGAYFRWINNRSIGIEFEISWDHPAYGYSLGSVAIPPDLPKTGIYGQFKVTYTFGLGDSYIKTWKKIKGFSR